MALLVLVAALAAACSDAVRPTPATSGPALAEQLIAGPLADQAGLGRLSPTCPDPGPLAVGTTFTCTATHAAQPGDPALQVHVAVKPDGHLALTTLNLITPAALPAYRTDAAAQVSRTVGADVAADAVDCGTAAVVVADDNVLLCKVTMGPGKVYDLRLTITDVNGRRFTAEVANPPRA